MLISWYIGVQLLLPRKEPYLTTSLVRRNKVKQNLSSAEPTGNRRVTFYAARNDV